jgi:hypothetical protein
MQFLLGKLLTFDSLAAGSVCAEGGPLKVSYPKARSMRIGVVMRRSPGVTRWAKWAWKATAVLPGAGDADWKVLREEEGVTEYHAATETLWLYVSDTEAYVHELQSRQPSIYVVLRQAETDTPMPLKLVHVTASPYEAQDYSDSAEEIVERVPMSPGVLAWVQDFVATHHVEEPFVKRRRDKHRDARKQSGIGDSRISQESDVFRAPGRSFKEAAE